MQKRLPVILLLSAVAGLSSCSENASKENAKQTFISTGFMDSAVKPGDDFYKFINGKWLDTAQIASTESSAGAGLELRNRTRDNLKSLLNDAMTANAAAGTIEQKVGDFYASGLDTVTINKLGFDPVKPALQQINDIKDTKQLLQFVAAQQKTLNQVLFSDYVSSDAKNSAKNILILVQGGLGLPDRDYYFKTDQGTVDVVNAYRSYAQKLFSLTGDDSATAAKNANILLFVEKQMASAHKTNVELRDPESNYHKMALDDFDKQNPTLAIKSVLADMGIQTDSVNVSQPAFFSKLNELLKTTSLDSWKAYLRFHVLDNAADGLSSDFENASFEYHGKALSGQQQLKPRQERITEITDGNLGEALGQLYVKKYFPEEAKKRMLELVNNLQKAFEARIGNLDWMSDSTKMRAKEKLAAFTKKIGYPDKWRDYSKVNIDKTKYFDNLQSCAANEFAYQASKIGKPVDKTEWLMTPPTINAYYNPTMNEIVFPAGILQFPFFDMNADDAINYGAIGMVIGHEMTHGFDDEGAQYDKDGNLKLWWSKEDYAKFQEKSNKVINMYNSFTVLDSLHVNGALTNGENLADMGGIAIAYDAFKMTAEGKDTTKIDGFTPDQRFFISVAQSWRRKMKDPALMQMIKTNPHSPGVWRVMGPLMNIDAFYAAFNVQPGDKMYKAPADRIKIW